MLSSSYRLLGAVALLWSSHVGFAFQTPMPQSTSRWTTNIKTIPRIPSRIAPVSRNTQRSMYNLPPSGGGGGGGGNNDNVITQVLTGALTVGGIVLFFASPLGGIFFAITNSLFLLALITPVVLTIAFQVWQSLNTVAGPCPNCGAPARVIKDVNQPSLCFNCGSILQVDPDLKTIGLSTPTRRQGGGFIDMDQPGATMSGAGASFFDVFSRGQPTTVDAKQKEQKFRRETTIVDVEVAKDD